MSNGNRNLQHYVHRTLAWRILLLSTLCAIALMAVFYHLEEQRIEKRVVERATIALDVFNTARKAYSRNPEPFSEPGLLQAEIDQFMMAADYRDTTRDKFIAFRIFDSAFGVRAVSFDLDFPDLRRIVNNLAPVSGIDLSSADRWYRVIIDGDATLIHIVIPVSGFEPGKMSYFEGLFSLSPQTVAGIDHGAWRSAFIGLAIVLLTSAIIYPVVRGLTTRLSLLSQSLLESNLETLQVLGSAIAKRDSDTNAHNYRVTLISVRLAEKIGLDNRSVRSLIKGAFLHDVGKIGIADNILLKPGKLDDDEYKIMKTHVDHGEEIVARSGWLNDANEVVSCHHEQVAGSGYPRSLSDREIPVNARIFAIADVFDALTARRPYKEPFSFERTMEILHQDKGTHFDKDLVNAFDEIARELYDDLANREDGLEEELDAVLRSYFPGGKDDLDDAARLQQKES